MALRYTGVTIGTLTLCQPVREKQGDKYVEQRDERGRIVYNRFKIQLRECNALMCAIHAWKDPQPEDPERPWHHDLQMFFVDEGHMKRCLKEYKTGGGFEELFAGKLRNIRLNTYYKEMQTLARYMTRDGLTVQCYYKEPKKK